MNLGEFRDIIKSKEPKKVFNWGISEPFSWRGLYEEVAFSILKEPMTREEILENIERAFSETFLGWKGGEYTYDKNTVIHFEEAESIYSDADYLKEMFVKIAFS